MFAVIKTGGKQYRVAKDDVISVEKLSGDAGDTVVFDEILMIGEGKDATIGEPVVKGAQVSATVLGQDRNDKIIVFKKKRRQNYRRKAGHRQDITVLRIADIHPKGGAKAKAAPKAAAETKAKAAKPAAPAKKAGKEEEEEEGC